MLALPLPRTTWGMHASSHTRESAVMLCSAMQCNALGKLGVRRILSAERELHYLVAALLVLPHIDSTVLLVPPFFIRAGSRTYRRRKLFLSRGGWKGSRWLLSPPFMCFYPAIMLQRFPFIAVVFTFQDRYHRRALRGMSQFFARQIMKGVDRRCSGN